jgi:cytochrome c2
LACTADHMAPIGSHKEFMYWLAAALVATGLLAFTLLQNRGSVNARNSATVTGIPEEGAKLFYGSKHCSDCHTANGFAGHKPVAPAMGWLIAVLWNHGPDMWRTMQSSGQTYPSFDRQEMAHLLAFLYQIADSDPPGDSEAGRRAFQEKGCVRCHVGLSAKNKNTLIAALWNHAQQMIQPAGRALGEWPRLDGESMNNLSAYLSAASTKADRDQQPARGDAERGWRAFQAKCMPCHALRKQDASRGPVLGPETELLLSPSQFGAALWNHLPGMTQHAKGRERSLSTLDQNEIADLAEFLRSLRYAEPAGSRFIGEKVFADRGCVRCHGTLETGELGVRLRAQAKVFTAVSLAAVLWQHGPRLLDRTLNTSGSRPTLQPTDAADLVAFLNASLERK